MAFNLLIGLALGMVVVTTGISVYALVLAVRNHIDIGAMKGSTHTLQYVDPKTEMPDVDKQMAEAEGAFYEGQLDDRRDENGPAL